MSENNGNASASPRLADQLIVQTSVAGLTGLAVVRHFEFNGQRLDLTMTEAKLFVMMFDRLDQIVGRSLIFEFVFPDAQDGLTNNVDVYVSYLRAKIKKIANFPLEIETVRGVGYKMQLTKEVKI